MTDPHDTAWEGTYFDGETAARHAVSVRVTDRDIRIQRDDAPHVVWPYGEVRQTQGARPGEPVRLERGRTPQEVLLVQDPSLLQAIIRIAPQYHRRFTDTGRRGRRTRLALGAAAAAVAAAAAAYVWGIPALAARAAAAVPLDWEESLGRSAVEQTVGSATVCPAPDALDRLVDQLANTEPNRYAFRVAVVDDTLVNAFAAPGGYLVIYRGLLELAEAPEELAGVLAHEMQHVLLQHGTQSVLRQIPLQLIVLTVTADAGVAGQVVGTAAALGALRYSRRDEEEADREGMRMLRDAGVDPRGMVDFMGRMESRVGDIPQFATYLSTHPRTEERIRTLEQLAGDAPTKAAPLLSESEWREVRGACGAGAKRGM